MTAAQRVLRTQRVLGFAAITQAITWGFATTVGLLALTSFAALAIPALEDGGILGSHLAAAIVLGALATGLLLWRSRHLVSSAHVALWIEERIPALQYALVTAVEHSGSRFATDIESAVASHDVGPVTSAALKRSLTPALGALGASMLLLYVSPSADFGRAGIFPRLGAPGVAVPAGSRLENLRVRVTPPDYTGKKSVDFDDPSSIQALTGSRILIRGSGSASGVTASLQGRTLPVSAAGNDWSLAVSMQSSPGALTLKDRRYERILVLDPQTDSPPKIALSSPAHDTTLRVARLVIRLEASASDDIGLSGGYFEYLITTGSGEIFSARTVTTPVIRFGGARSASLNASLDLAGLKLNQGDVVSIRAIVQDVNTLSGPGIATSDTRTFRIARADEYDSVAVDAAAPMPVDSSAISQRMLIAMTEQLVKEKPKITRVELVRRSGIIGDLEDRIRKRVQEILYENEEVDGEGETAEAAATVDPTAPLEEEEPDRVRENKNPDLFEAFTALWAAVRSLQIAEPAPALPEMRIALKALDRIRLANRVYLRGTPPRVIVDLARVRMAGKEKGSSSTRSPRSAADSARVRLEQRFNLAVEQLEDRPAEASRTLTLMQVEALSVSPGVASAIGEAIEAIRKGRDATLPLLRVRRLVSGEASAASGLSPWSGGW